MDWNAFSLTLLFCVGIASVIGAIFTFAESAVTADVYGWTKHARNSAVACAMCAVVAALCASLIAGMVWTPQ